MNFSKKNHKLVDQNERFEKKPQKHDANLQKNTTLYFQVGLILVLLATYGLLEMQFQVTKYDPSIQHPLEDDYDLFAMTEYKIFEEEAPKEKVVEKKVKRVILTPTIKVIDNVGDDTPESKLVDLQPKASSKGLNPDDVIDVIEVPEDVNILAVEQVPIFPGCEKYTTNAERRKCMSDKINKLVTRKFNTDIASETGLEGIQRINVMFTIDKQGNVTDVKARAPHPRLEREAERVVNKIPNMKPGKQEKNEVNVIYNLPIIFKVRN